MHLTEYSLLGTASSLLTTLNNPLNVKLLTSQLLSSPAIWTVPEGLSTCMRGLSVFHSAAQALVRHEHALQDNSHDQDFEQLQPERTLPKRDWIRAVVKGADKDSPRWRHLLVIGGLLLGFGPYEEGNLSRGMRGTLGSALGTATNLALQETPDDDELGLEAITLVLNHCFPMLSAYERSRIDYDLLLPVLMRITLHSTAGLQSGYFLSTVNLDVIPAARTQLSWSEHSSSFRQIQAMLSSPLSSSLGPLARLIGHSIEQVKQARLVSAAIEDIEAFSRTLHAQWRQNKLSDVDSFEEGVYLDRETIEKTTPVLWKLLRSTLFATVIILRSAVGRMIGDSTLARDNGKAILEMSSPFSLTHAFPSRARGSHTSAVHASQLVLHLHPNWSYSIFAVHVCVPDCDGCVGDISPTSPELSAIHQTYGNGPCTITPSRPQSRLVLSEHWGAFHLGCAERDDRKSAGHRGDALPSRRRQ